jgi:3-deoxy-7-phosphoheptulonate synthase
MSCAAVSAGADGLILEVHSDPSTALCDGKQSLTPREFQALCRRLPPYLTLEGKRMGDDEQPFCIAMERVAR